MLTSIETIQTQHACAVTYNLHVQKVHAMHCICPEYHIEPTALHVRIGIVILL